MTTYGLHVFQQNMKKNVRGLWRRNAEEDGMMILQTDFH